MKKKYFIPELKVVVIQTQKLLAGSEDPEQEGTGGDSGNEGF